jgi:hypothetical protein
MFKVVFIRIGEEKTLQNCPKKDKKMNARVEPSLCGFTS